MQTTEEIVETTVNRQLRSKMVTGALLVVVAVTLLLPVWIVEYPPLLDYPNHLARSFVLTHMHDPAYHFSSYFKPDWGPYPYLTMDVAFMAAQLLFPVAVAGKIVLSLCLLGVPLACWWFVRNASPGNDWIALWGLLLASNEFFLESFLAFQFGLIACFVMLGFWLRWKDQLTFPRWLGLLGLSLAIYFSHLICFILAGFVVTVFLVFNALQRIFKAPDKRRAFRTKMQALFASCSLFIPGCVLYLRSGLGTHNGTYIHFRTFSDKVEEIVRTLFVGYSPRLTTACVWLAIACLALAWIRNRQFTWRWPWVATALAALALYAALPYSYGETFDIDVRVLPVFFVLMFAVADFGAHRAKIIGLVALVLFGIRTATIVRTFRSEQPELQAIARGVALMKPNSLMFTIVQPRQEHDPNRWPYEHYWAWAVIQRGAFSPYLFDLKGQTPLRTTYDSYTSDGFWDAEYDSDDVNWDKVQAQYDYVWLYNVDIYVPELNAIGRCISQYGAFRLYEIDKSR